MDFAVFTAPSLYGIPGNLLRGITHEWDVDTPTGTFNAFEELTWSGGSGRLLAINSTTAATKLWLQLLTGSVPGDGVTVTGTASTATVDTEFGTGQSTSRTISTPFVGVSTGTALIGSYGFGVEADDLSSTDLVFDLTNTQVNPPNNVTFTVFGLISGEDRVLVSNDNAGGIDFAQMTLSITLDGGTETIINVGSANIPADTPSSGNLRVELDDGRHRLIAYTSHDGDDEFTTASTDWQDPDDATSGNDVFLAYIDKLAGATEEAYTTVYDSDRTLFIRVRDGGGTPIKTFETTGTLGNAGGSATAIRTPDA